MRIRSRRRRRSRRKRSKSRRVRRVVGSLDLPPPPATPGAANELRGGN